MSETANMRQDYRNPREGIDLAKDSAWPDQSARHADQAVSHAIAAVTTSDSRTRESEIRLAQMYATLSLRDKVDELNQTIAGLAGHAIEVNAELSETIKKATQHVVVELRKHQVKPAPNGETEAA